MKVNESDFPLSRMLWEFKIIQKESPNDRNKLKNKKAKEKKKSIEWQVCKTKAKKNRRNIKAFKKRRTRHQNTKKNLLFE